MLAMRRIEKRPVWLKRPSLSRNCRAGTGIPVGEKRGIGLSGGGQKRRIALARALLVDPKILILT